MDDLEKLNERAARLRDLARQARRLASTVSNGDRDRLQRYAQELDEQAAAIGDSQPAPPTVTFQQQQVQQQQSADETQPPDPKPKEPN